MVDTATPAPVPPAPEEPAHVACEAAELWPDIQALNAIKAERARLDAAEAPILERIKRHLEEHNAEDLTVDGRTMVTWRATKAPVRFDATRFKKDHPALHLAYSKVGRPSRPFKLVGGVGQ